MNRHVSYRLTATMILFEPEKYLFDILYRTYISLPFVSNETETLAISLVICHISRFLSKAARGTLFRASGLFVLGLLEQQLFLSSTILVNGIIFYDGCIVTGNVLVAHTLINVNKRILRVIICKWYRENNFINESLYEIFRSEIHRMRIWIA